MTALNCYREGASCLPKGWCCNILASGPGERVELDLLPNGRAALSAIQQKASLRTLHGFLKGKTNGKVLTVEEMDDAIAEAGAAAGAGE